MLRARSIMIVHTQLQHVYTAICNHSLKFRLTINIQLSQRISSIDKDPVSQELTSVVYKSL